MSVLNELKKGKSQSHNAKNYGIDPTSGSRIKSDHSKIESAMQNNRNMNEKPKRETNL